MTFHTMSSHQPNLILIMTDQQRFDTIAAAGFPHMVTPNLDALIRRSVAFSRAFCPGVTCVASRAATFTGMYPHNTGTYSFFDWAHQRTWIQDLADAGYWCANIGKMHLQPRDASGGFHERLVVENPTSVNWGGGCGDDAWGRYLALHGHVRPNHRHRTDLAWLDKFQSVPWSLPDHLHPDVFVGDSAVAWIDNYAVDRPLFLQIGFTGPHEPWDPMQRHLDMYRHREIPSPVDFPGDLSAKPPQHAAHRDFHATTDHESVIDMRRATLADIVRFRRHYYAKITMVDEQIGRIVSSLEKKKLLENSLLVFCSDHGEMLGDHGLAYKWLMYESVARVPLFIVPSAAFARHAHTPSTQDSLVSLLDIGPTLLEAAGVTCPTYLEGRSLLPALQGGELPPREAIFCEDNYQIMMRTDSHKLVVYLGQSEGEFYDLSLDPDERRNLWAAASAKPLRDSLERRLFEWLARSVYFNSPYKTRVADQKLRWPAQGDPSLHGPNLWADNTIGI